MKKITTFLTLIITLSSCSIVRISKHYKLDNPSDQPLGLNPQIGKHVLKSDSTVIPFEKIDLKKPWFKKGTITLDDELKMPYDKQIAAIQYEDSYWLTNGKYSNFQRILYAPISVYKQTIISTSTSQATGFTQTSKSYRFAIQKNNGNLLDYNAKNVMKLVEDYDPSVETMNEFFRVDKKLKTKKTINVLVGLGSLILMTKATNKKSESLAAVSLAVFLGTGVNGFINIRKRLKNHDKVQLALDDYNWAMKPKATPVKK